MCTRPCLLQRLQHLAKELEHSSARFKELTNKVYTDFQLPNVLEVYQYKLVTVRTSMPTRGLLCRQQAVMVACRSADLLPHGKGALPGL